MVYFLDYFIKYSALSGRNLGKGGAFDTPGTSPTLKELAYENKTQVLATGMRHGAVGR